MELFSGWMFSDILKYLRKYFFVAVAVLLFFPPLYDYAEEKKVTPGQDIEYIKVSDSVVIARHGYGANIICFALDNGLVFSDCGMRTEVTARFRRDMEKNFGKKTLALFITHAHIDHFFGMAAFSDVKVFASRKSEELFTKQLHIEFSERRIRQYDIIFPGFRESLSTAKPFLPTDWFDKEMSMGEGEKRVVFKNTGGHTAGSSSAYLISEGVLAVGDLVQVDRYPYFGDPDVDIKQWIESLKYWESLDVKKVCPGHGRIVGSDYVRLVREFFERMVAVLKKLKDSNIPVPEVSTHPALPEGYWGDKVKRPVWYGFCIERLYKKM